MNETGKSNNILVIIMDARVKTIWSGGLKTSSLIRGFEAETDKPKIYFGTNTAPAPAELFAASIGACFVTTFVLCSFRKHLKFEEVTGDVIVKIANSNSESIKEIDLKIKVWADPDHQSDLEKCFEYAKANCSLTKVVNIPINTSIEYKAIKE
jgi:organic hydroperoxide reductase OsmC/OhrA